MALAQHKQWQVPVWPQPDALATAGVAAVHFPADALARIQHWTQQQPESLALLHKQQGDWLAWRWSDLAHTLAQLQPALLQQGLGPQPRLAVSGALEPQLIVLALAAHTAGAAVFALDRHAQGEALQQALWAAAPTHAFVQERSTIATWQHSGFTAANAVPLYTAKAVAPLPAQEDSSWRIVPVTELLPSSASAAPHQAVSQPSHFALRRQHRQPHLWVDEGTEWAGGLEQVLAAWLGTGSTLAAPELSASATRDRHEIQPQRLLASTARQQALQAELQARFASPRSVAGRLSHWAANGRGGALLAWLPRRIAKLHGLPIETSEEIHSEASAPQASIAKAAV